MSARRPPTQTLKRRGRPPGVRNIGTIVKEIALEEVVVRDAAGTHRMSLAQAILKKLQLSAMKGNLAADKFLDDLRLRNAPQQASDAGVLVVPGMLSQEEWVRRQEAENMFRTEPEGLPGIAKEDPPVALSAPPEPRPAGAGVTIVPQPWPRLIR